MVPTATHLLDVALIELASPDGPGEATAVGACLESAFADELHAAVGAHRLEGSMRVALEVLDRDIPEDLADVVADDRVTRLLVEQALGRAAIALGGAGVPWLTFKGPLISRLMARPELRTFNDLDLLVAADRFADAVDVLTETGIVELNRNWVPYLEHRVGEVPMVCNGVSVDLHWHVVGLGRDRSGVRFEPHAMLDRRRMVTMGEKELPTFDAEDQLLHLAVHSALSGASRLDQLRDLVVVTTADTVDWDVVVARARSARVARLVGHALDRAHRVLGAPVPASAITALAGRALSRRRRRDGERVGSLPTSAVVWQRDGSAAAAQAIAFRFRDRFAGAGAGWDFTDPDGRLYYDTPSGGDEIRREFFDRVAEWAVPTRP